ncbi:MAG: ribonuclease P protein component [Legionella sp.]|nr:ribonuclease P protein component [Legionella sp.]
MNYPFDRSRRLLTKRDYAGVFACPQKMVSREFVILYSRNSLGKARLGLALSKKMLPKAHDRNRMKRLLRETFRVEQLPPVDIVVLARHGLASIDNEKIISSLVRSWKKLLHTANSSVAV